VQSNASSLSVGDSPERTRRRIGQQRGSLLEVLGAATHLGLTSFGGPIGRRLGLTVWAVVFGLLLGLPLLSQSIPTQPLAIFDRFFRVGSLVFGGGHVVLPLLQAEVVPPGWVTNEQLLAGYGAAQAVPGPLFTFAAYLGAVMALQPSRTFPHNR